MIFVSNINTPIGEMQIASTTQGICMLEFTDANNKHELFIKKISVETKQPIVFEKNEHIHLAEMELENYFNKNLQQFSVPLHLFGTPFQKDVWMHLQQIPFAKVISYKQQAIQMQNILGIRAIASANGKNKIAIIIPCHRVIGSNGSLTGYAGGMWRKKWLLQHEGILEKNLL